MNKKIIYGIIALIAVIAIVFLVFQIKKQPAPKGDLLNSKLEKLNDSTYRATWDASTQMRNSYQISAKDESGVVQQFRQHKDSTALTFFSSRKLVSVLVRPSGDFYVTTIEEVDIDIISFGSSTDLSGIPVADQLHLHPMDFDNLVDAKNFLDTFHDPCNENQAIKYNLKYFVSESPEYHHYPPVYSSQDQNLDNLIDPDPLAESIVNTIPTVEPSRKIKMYRKTPCN